MPVNTAQFEAVALDLETRFVSALGALPPTVLNAICVDLTANKATKRIPMGALLSGMREWFGSRHHNQIAAYLESVPMRKFEHTIDISRDDIEDQEIDIYQPQVQEMARGAEAQWEDLVVECIDTNGRDTDFPLFDGLPLFHASHVWKGSEVAAQGNTTTGALDETKFYAVETAMLAYKRPNGEIFKSRPTHVLYANGQQSTIDGLFNAPTGAAGASNKLYGRIPRENQILLPGLTTGHWALADATRVIKPVLRIIRRAVEFHAVTNPESGGPAFDTGMYSYGIDCRRAVAAPAWWLWYGSTG